VPALDTRSSTLPPRSIGWFDVVHNARSPCFPGHVDEPHGASRGRAVVPERFLPTRMCVVGWCSGRRGVGGNGTENRNKLVIRRVFQGYGAETGLLCPDLRPHLAYRLSSRSGAFMKVLSSALTAAVLSAVAGVILCALAGAVWFEFGALREPNADLQPSTAWIAGFIWIGLGFGPYAAAGGAVIGLLVGRVRRAGPTPKDQR
jgi:hypothetical protein